MPMCVIFQRTGSKSHVEYMRFRANWVIVHVEYMSSEFAIRRPEERGKPDIVKCVRKCKITGPRVLVASAT